MYYGVVLVVSGLNGFDGLLTLASGTTATAPLLQAVGGLGVVVATVYTLGSSDDPSESVPGRPAVKLVVLGTALVVVAYLLRHL